MTSKSWAKSLLPALALGLVTTGCSGSTEASSVSTKVLTVAASAAVTTWDPVRSFSTEALYLGNVYEPLLWKNPAGSGVYFVNGDITSADDLRRAGIEEATAAVVCPADPSNESDMRSILAVMAIESIAPDVSTVVEVNNPAHVEHFRRAHADEIMVTSRIASRQQA